MNKWVEYQELPGQDGLRKLNERLLFKKEDFKDATVLDLGCWAGQIMLQSKKWGAKEVFGVDIDSDVVVLGRKFGRRAFEFSKSPTYKAKFVNFYTIKN